LSAFIPGFVISLQPEFSNPFLSVLSVFNMALGETSFVENFIVNNKGPLYYDNLFLIFTFMMGISIALVNLLIGIAVGDIDAIRSASNITLIKLQVITNQYLVIKANVIFLITFSSLNYVCVEMGRRIDLIHLL